MIELLVGMIASGKSRWAQQRARKGYVVINDDAIVSLLHGGDTTLYSKSLKPLYKSIETQILHTAVAMGRDVVVDKGVNISLAARKRWIALASSLDMPIMAVEFPRVPSAVHAGRRFQADARGHDLEFWIRAAEAHERRYTSPSVEEGFADIFYT